MNLNGNQTAVVQDSYTRPLLDADGNPALDPEGAPLLETVQVKLVVAEADVLIATRRYRLSDEGLQSFGIKDGAMAVVPPGVDEDLFNLRVLTYPNLVAATLSAEGIPWPLSFEQFLHLREPLWDRWTEAVVRLNPQWYPRARDAGLPKAPTITTSASPAI